MPIVVKKAGLNEFGKGGTARLKALIIGGPGAGKTVWASTWDRPIFLDVEGGLASVAHLEVPYISINSSQDMNDALQFLKMEASKPVDQRQYNTVVIDTFDAFQRKLKTEWMIKNRQETFNGFEAWNWMSTRCSVTGTRLLNLDMNVVVNCHYKDKVVQSKDGDSTREVTQFMLQLQGETADTIFNDYDLVGFMDTEWLALEGERSLTHHLTFTPTPDKPFLKDRLAITPKRMMITIGDDTGYKGLLASLEKKMAALKPSAVITEIPTYNPEAEAGEGVAPPAGVGGSVIGQDAKADKDGTLSSLDKATLAQIAKDEGITSTADGQPIKGNTIKSELIEAIRFHRGKKDADQPAPAPAPESAPTAAKPVVEDPLPTSLREGDANWQKQKATTEALLEEQRTKDAVAGALARQREANARTAQFAADKTTGELPDGVKGPEGTTAPYRETTTAEETKATKTAEELLGAVAIDEDTPVTKRQEPKPQTAPAPTPEPAPAPAPAPAATEAPRRGRPDLSQMSCAQCGKNLGDENPDYVKLSKIKFGKFMCKDDYMNARKS